MLGREIERGRNRSLSIVWETPVEPGVWTLRWIQGNDEAKSAKRIEYREVNVDGVAPHRIFNASIAGLRPGQPFTYDLLLDDMVVFSAGAMAPKAPGQAFRFALMGNPGRGSRNLKALAYRVYEARPDLLVLLGDLVPGKGRMSDYQRGWWSMVNNNQAATVVGAPLLRSTLTVAVPGKVDTGGRDVRKRGDSLAYYPYWIQPDNGPRVAFPISGPTMGLRQATGPSFGRGGTFSFDYGNVHWTVLDSNMGKRWLESAELRTWLEADLRGAASVKWRFVAFYDAAFGLSSIAGVSPMRFLGPTFSNHKVDIVFMSEQENYQRRRPWVMLPPGREDRVFDGVKNVRPKGTIAIVSGAAVDTAEDFRAPAAWISKNWVKFLAVPSVTMVDIDGGKLVLRQVGTDGRELDRIQIVK
jgi:hypothetical protein